MEGLKDFAPILGPTAMLNGLGFGISTYWPKYKGKIPYILPIVGAFLFPLMYDWGDIVLNVGAVKQFTITIMVGIIQGFSAIGTHQAFIKAKEDVQKVSDKLSGN